MPDPITSPRHREQLDMFDVTTGEERTEFRDSPLFDATGDAQLSALAHQASQEDRAALRELTR